MMSSLSLPHKSLLQLVLCVAVSQALMAQTPESTRTTEYSALRFAYDDLSKTVTAIHRLVYKANEGIDCRTGTEYLKVDNGVSGITITEDFSPAALSGAPETAYSVEYYYSC